ncbi:hypothetical protein Slin15195_G114620 [Septoria linicola]|uniref:Uncharacterized protein n=1 Tax=Septoria linicola TaxID=215465 RepID=A0A9Q9ER26_9PEZI|nr:hypothetical protein Slin15195_G114620 [Septoria linicola]
MAPLPANLQSALDTYRERVLNFRVTTISHLLSRIEDQASREASSADQSDTETQAAILRTLTKDYLRQHLPSSPSISRACDLLNNRPLLAEHFQLDGVLRGNVDVEKRQAWFTSVHNKLARLREESNRSDSDWPAALTAELQSLMINVPGIMQPGLNYRDHYGTDLFNPGFESISDARVFSPSGDDELTLVWPGWDVAAAVRLAKGESNPSTALALFCRDEYDEENSSEWAWRYGICDEEWCSELFDDIESLLEWFATYGLPTEENVNRERIIVDWGWPKKFQNATFG